MNSARSHQLLYSVRDTDLRTVRRGDDRAAGSIGRLPAGYLVGVEFVDQHLDFGDGLVKEAKRRELLVDFGVGESSLLRRGEGTYLAPDHHAPRVARLVHLVDNERGRLRRLRVRHLGAFGLVAHPNEEPRAVIQVVHRHRVGIVVPGQCRGHRGHAL